MTEEHQEDPSTIAEDMKDDTDDDAEDVVWIVTVLELDMEDGVTLKALHQCVFDDEDGADNMVVGEIMRCISMRLIQDHPGGTSLAHAMLDARFDDAAKIIGNMGVGISIFKEKRDVMVADPVNQEVVNEAIKGMMVDCRTIGAK